MQILLEILLVLLLFVYKQKILFSKKGNHMSFAKEQLHNFNIRSYI